MEFFRDAYSVRLMCQTGKYLWADEDKKSVAQRRGKDTYGVIWRVELVPGRDAVRLKSVYDLYLMASDYAFLLGVTGKKVLQSRASKADSSLEWEPIAAGTFVKLMTKGEKFLRANGGMPPYRNSITHDVPVLASNQHVVLWEVEVVRKNDAPSLTPSRMISPRQSNASRPKSPPPPPPQPESSDEEETPPPPLTRPRARANPPPRPVLESSSSDDDETPPTPPARPRARANPPPRPALESSSSDDDQTPPRPPARPRARPNPRRDESYSPLPSEQGTPPRAQRRRSPPSEALRNTHIDRRRDARYDESPPPRREGYASSEGGGYGYRATAREGYASSEGGGNGYRAAAREGYASSASEGGYRAAARRVPPEYESSHSGTSTPRRSLDGEEKSRERARDVRRIFYSVAEDDGEVLAHDNETFGTFMFQGQSLEELAQELQRVTGIREDIILCMRNPLSAKLYKMRLALPQNNAPLSVVVVRSSSEFGRTFSAQTPNRQR